MSEMLSEKTSRSLFETFQWLFNKTQTRVFDLISRIFCLPIQLFLCFKLLKLGKMSAVLKKKENVRRSFSFVCFGGSVLFIWERTFAFRLDYMNASLWMICLKTCYLTLFLVLRHDSCRIDIPYFAIAWTSSLPKFYEASVSVRLKATTNS